MKQVRVAYSKGLHILLLKLLDLVREILHLVIILFNLTVIFHDVDH